MSVFDILLLRPPLPNLILPHPSPLPSLLVLATTNNSDVIHCSGGMVHPMPMRWMAERRRRRRRRMVQDWEVTKGDLMMMRI